MSCVFYPVTTSYLREGWSLETGGTRGSGCHSSIRSSFSCNMNHMTTVRWHIHKKTLLLFVLPFLHWVYLLCQFIGLMKFVGLREQKSDDPQYEDPFQDQVISRSLRNTWTWRSFWCLNKHILTSIHKIPFLNGGNPYIIIYHVDQTNISHVDITEIYFYFWPQLSHLGPFDLLAGTINCIMKYNVTIPLHYSISSWTQL